MITVRFFAAAREAAQTSQIQADVQTLEELIGNFSKDNPRLLRILEQSSFLVDGLVAHDRKKNIANASTVDVLPPFAGG